MLKVGTGSAEAMPSLSPVWPIPSPVGPPRNLAGWPLLRLGALSFLLLADAALLFSSSRTRTQSGPSFLPTSHLP